MLEPVKGKAELFEKITREHAWEEIKKQLIDGKSRDLYCEDNLETMKVLVAYRDIVDFNLYKQAVEKIFPAADYNLNVRASADLDEQTHKLLSDYFEFIVTKRADVRPSRIEQKACCIIKINSPGSRHLTSDIDTSILSTLKFIDSEKSKQDFFEKAAAEVKVKTDHEGAISVMVIDGFYQLSEEEFGRSSGPHRDSNAYLDLMTKDEEEYPKFKENDQKDPDQTNPMIVDKRFFTTKEFIQQMSPYKKQKHELEMAASLFSLKEALDLLSVDSKQEPAFLWEQFKTQLKETVLTMMESYYEGMEKDQATKKTAEDIEKICETVEELNKYYHTCMKTKQIELEQGEYGKTSQLTGQEKEEDIRIAAMNRLYVEWLRKMVNCSSKLLEYNQNISLYATELSRLVEDIKQLEKKIERNKEDKAYQKEVVQWRQELSTQTALEKQTSDNLKGALRDKAKEKINKLHARITAHTFANEAYVNRSAVYHVVKGSQQQGKIAMTDQTLLGSVLQQLGFKLLHTQQLLNSGKGEEEAAYLTSKYGQRMKELIFPESRPIDMKKLKKTLKMNTLEILSQLKSTMIHPYCHQDFDLVILQQLNLETKIVYEIKKNGDIADSDKVACTRKLLDAEPTLQQTEKSLQPLYCQLASTVMGYAYISRLQRKAGHLWGEYDGSDQASQVSEDKVSQGKRKIETDHDKSEGRGDQKSRQELASKGKKNEVSGGLHIKSMQAGRHIKNFVEETASVDIIIDEQKAHEDIVTKVGGYKTRSSEDLDSSDVLSVGREQTSRP